MLLLKQDLNSLQQIDLYLLYCCMFLLVCNYHHIFPIVYNNHSLELKWLIKKKRVWYSFLIYLLFLHPGKQHLPLKRCLTPLYKSCCMVERLDINSSVSNFVTEFYKNKFIYQQNSCLFIWNIKITFNASFALFSIIDS